MMEGAVTVSAMPSGTAGTPTATKGTVSNHSISVTPSVTNTAGYIAGGTKSGTAVTVSASELVSGNLPITSNGNNIDVTNYATVSVSVDSGVSVTQDQDGFIILPPDGGGSPSVGGLEYEEGTYTTAEAVSSVDISFSNTHTNVPFFVGFVDVTGDYNSTLNTGYVWWYFDWYELFGKGIYYNSTSQYYAYRNYRYRSSSATSITGSASGITSYPDTTNLTNTYFHVSFSSANLIPNRTYKWVAVWKPAT